jgi:hypothetical protein
MDFNINDAVMVKLTPAGHEAAKSHWRQYAIEWRAPPEDAEGFSKWQLWDLMQTFGSAISMGLPVPFETTIRIPSPPPHQRAE